MDIQNLIILEQFYAKMCVDMFKLTYLILKKKNTHKSLSTKKCNSQTLLKQNKDIFTLCNKKVPERHFKHPC